MVKFFSVFFILFTTFISAEKQPNVIFIITDDQGYGDFGIKGNPIIKTPNIDAMAKRSFEMKRFYVNAVCSPTRASIMTGRNSYRTGVTDTFKGRSIMRTEEVTLAEILNEAGYSTGLFGKWHLGDNYPFRPMDQGFDHAIYHLGGGLGQPSEPKENQRRYTDAILFENGKKTQTKGFCCDVYFDEAINWFKQQNKAGKPFFAYIASNTPHSPYHDVPQEWLDYYSKIDLSPKNFPQTKGHPIPTKHFKQDVLARVYAMVSNIDDNVGKLFNHLEKEKLMKDTIVIYMNDNGPNTLRYVGGFADKKSSHKEGGTRSPIWWHWPQNFKANGSSDLITAHVDIMPTLAELCSAKMPNNKTIDGRSIATTLLGGSQSWDSRKIILQSHRGEKPERLVNTSVIQQYWKIESTGQDQKLYHLKNDSYAMDDVSLKYPEKKSELIHSYDKWFNGLDDEYPEMWSPLWIEVNHQKEPELILSKQEYRNDAWYLKVNQTKSFELAFNVSNDLPEIETEVYINDKLVNKLNAKLKNGQYSLPKITLPKGKVKLNVSINAPAKVTKLWHVFLQQA